MHTRAEPTPDDPDDGPGDETADRRFDGPWLRFLAVALVGWAVAYGLDRVLLAAGSPVGAAAAFTHGYLLAPLVTAAILLDALSLAERNVAELGVFNWLYALAALMVPPVALVYYAHREWLRPDDETLLSDPT